jgi:hypothetical protein
VSPGYNSRGASDVEECKADGWATFNHPRAREPRRLHGVRHHGQLNAVFGRLIRGPRGVFAPYMDFRRGARRAGALASAPDAYHGVLAPRRWRARWSRRARR